jgi:hypothetical protein
LPEAGADVLILEETNMINNLVQRKRRGIHHTGEIRWRIQSSTIVLETVEVPILL